MGIGKAEWDHSAVVCVGCRFRCSSRVFRFQNPQREAHLAIKSTMSAVIRVYDEAGNVIETHEHAGDFKEW